MWETGKRARTRLEVVIQRGAPVPPVDPAERRGSARAARSSEAVIGFAIAFVARSAAADFAACASRAASRRSSFSPRHHSVSSLLMTVLHASHLTMSLYWLLPFVDSHSTRC